MVMLPDDVMRVFLWLHTCFPLPRSSQTGPAFLHWTISSTSHTRTVLLSLLFSSLSPIGYWKHSDSLWWIFFSPTSLCPCVLISVSRCLLTLAHPLLWCLTVPLVLYVSLLTATIISPPCPSIFVSCLIFLLHHYLCISPLFHYLPLPFSSLCLSVPLTLWSKLLQWIISQLTHRGQPKPPVQTWDNIQKIGCLTDDCGNKPPYQFKPGLVYTSAHKPH